MLCLASHRAAADSSFWMARSHLEGLAGMVLAAGEGKCGFYVGVDTKRRTDLTYRDGARVPNSVSVQKKVPTGYF